MIAVRRLLVQPDVREKVTRSILETLSDLPDNQKKMFIWKHYRGCQSKLSIPYHLELSNPPGIIYSFA